jgi:hypothetical protein
MKLLIGNQMNQLSKIRLQATIMMGMAVPSSASAGVLKKLESECLCLTEQATLGQVISLGVMLTLVITIISMKWIYRKEVEQSFLSKKLADEDSSSQSFRQLKIGEGFSNWSESRRLSVQKQRV